MKRKASASMRTKSAARYSQRLMPIPGIAEHFRDRDIRGIPGINCLFMNASGNLESRRREDIAGVPIPRDLVLICDKEAQLTAEWMEHVLTGEKGDREANEDLSLPIEDKHVRFVRREIAEAIQKGFFLALLRFAEDLKQVPEAAAMLVAIRRNGEKGTAVGKKKADSKRHEARGLDRELRKTVKKKYLRVQRIATKMCVSSRTVERYLSALK